MDTLKLLLMSPNIAKPNSLILLAKEHQYLQDSPQSEVKKVQLTQKEIQEDLPSNSTPKKATTT
jgi:hypothetical protein